jgi:flagellar FliJ protein
MAVTRSRRIEPVQRIVDDRERELAKVVARARQALTEAEGKLGELVRYRADYQQGFQAEASAGASGLRLRDFRLFLSRLDEAIRQQEGIVARAQADLDARTREWHESLRRAKALGVVIERWRGEERLAAERQEQKDTDERASGMAARRNGNRT